MVLGSEREAGASENARDIESRLGNHPIAQEMRELEPWRVMTSWCCPQMQGILTPVIEGFAA
jgi:hypothetical protein